MREFLEKNYTEEVAASEKETIKLAIKALLEVVQSGSKNIELAIMRNGQPMQVCHAFSVSMNPCLIFAPLKMLDSERLDALTKEIEAEKEAEVERKKAEKRAGGSDPAASSSS